MRHFRWNIESFSSFPRAKGRSAVAPRYIIPREHTNQIPALELAGATLWLHARARDLQVLIARLSVIRVEEIGDGYNEGDFLIWVDLTQSVRVVEHLDELRPSISSESTGPVGLSEISFEESANLSGTIQRLKETRFYAPSPMVVRRIDLPSTVGNPTDAARALMTSTVATFALTEVWSTANAPALGPFANFAYHRALYEPLADLDLIRAELAALDPTVSAFPTRMRVTSAQARAVDTNVTAVDPSLLRARRFVASAGSNVTSQDRLTKMDRAEQAHQDILRDIAEELQMNGVTPMESTSIDLFCRVGDRAFVFEVKSATQANLFAQVAHGCLQLILYRDAMLRAGEPGCEAVLVVEGTPDTGNEDLLKRVVLTAGIRLFTYERDLPWPSRVEGLLELLHLGSDAGVE